LHWQFRAAMLRVMSKLTPRQKWEIWLQRNKPGGRPTLQQLAKKYRVSIRTVWLAATHKEK
jgi:hypothetical protein